MLDDGEHDESFSALVACSQPLLSITAFVHALADSVAPTAVLEALTRRFYKIRALDGMRVAAVRRLLTFQNW